MAACLPRHLEERTRPLDDRAPVQGEFVLYWMHHAMRAHENPALDVAVAVANRLGLPALVYQGLGGRHPYDSDRHHMFILEGARDVQAACADRGIAYAFRLQGGRLRALAERAALVVVEDFPAPPFPRWTSRLHEAVDAPVRAVDGHCVVPMRLLDRSYARAFRFRRRTEEEFARRLGSRFDPVEPDAAPFAGDLGFEPLDLGRADLAALVASCDIDHSVGPVRHTRGGTRAGHARWERFKEEGLRSYARLRNDAAQAWPRGVSRMSPYLHYGMVSAFRIAREAAAARAEKFLDELLVWRELAHNFVFHRRDVESLDALPEWARETLEARAGDPRDALYSWEELARARTGERLWDLAQTSLLVHGELHNNVRMTWGKALLPWTRSPADALRLLLDLNHRYALDGSDPSSYGGLLWCLGLFDRPFAPEERVIGAVRPRSVAAHARRLDLERYAARVEAPARARALEVAVVGAGVSGLAAARTLADHRMRVTVFDRGRAPGGRIAAREIAGRSFDQGAQYFTARDRRFRRYVDSWCEQGLVAPWRARLVALEDGGAIERKADRETRYVGVPDMAAIARHLATDLQVMRSVTVAAASRDGVRWRLRARSGDDLGTFDAVVVAMPPASALPLLEELPALRERVGAVRLDPCWAALLAFEEPLGLDFDGAFVNTGPLSWVARNSSKPGRPDGEAWVAHASPAWSAPRLQADREAIARELTAAFFDVVAVESRDVLDAYAHRWSYSMAPEPLSEGCLFEAGIAVCGDWCLRSRVEGAFLSGLAAAGRVLGLPDDASRPEQLRFA